MHHVKAEFTRAGIAVERMRRLRVLWMCMDAVAALPMEKVYSRIIVKSGIWIVSPVRRHMSNPNV